MTSTLAIILTLISGLCGGIGIVLIKIGTPKFKLNLKQIKNYPLILGAGISGVGMLCFILALKDGELSMLYPIISIQYLISTFLAVKYLKEKMNLLKWAGITAIIVGIILIGLGL